MPPAELFPVHRNHVVGARAQVRRQPPRRGEQVVGRQAEGAGHGRYQVVWRWVLAFALDPGQVGDGDFEAARQFGQRHVPFFALPADIMPKAIRSLRGSCRLAQGRQKAACPASLFTICSHAHAVESILRNEPIMADQIVITEKSSQAKDVRAAVGSRYGAILPAEGHLFDLLEPEDVVPAWKRWSPILLRPDGLYGTRPAEGGNKAAKLRANREALRVAKRVWLATDCDREGQLIGQEILEHCNFRGQVMRVMFTAQDPRPFAMRSAGQNRTPNTAVSTPPPLRGGRPTRFTTCRSPAPRPSSGAACAHGDRRRPSEDADIGHRVQARVGNPPFRASCLF